MSLQVSTGSAEDSRLLEPGWPGLPNPQEFAAIRGPPSELAVGGQPRNRAPKPAGGICRSVSGVNQDQAYCWGYPRAGGFGKLGTGPMTQSQADRGGRYS